MPNVESGFASAWLERAASGSGLSAASRGSVGRSVASSVTDPTMGRAASATPGAERTNALARPTTSFAGRTSPLAGEARAVAGRTSLLAAPATSLAGHAGSFAGPARPLAGTATSLVGQASCLAHTAGSFAVPDPLLDGQTDDRATTTNRPSGGAADSDPGRARKTASAPAFCPTSGAPQETHGLFTSCAAETGGLRRPAR